MKSIVLIFYFLLVGIFESLSQDTIINKNNDTLSVKVIEITPTEVKYKKMDFLNGPLYVIFKTDILSIKYENGMVEKNIIPEPKKINYEIKASIDVDHFYKYYRNDAFKIYMRTLFFTPFVGYLTFRKLKKIPVTQGEIITNDLSLTQIDEYKTHYVKFAQEKKTRKLKTGFYVGCLTFFGIISISIIQVGQY